jgi:hypothetical protein
MLLIILCFYNGLIILMLNRSVLCSAQLVADSVDLILQALPVFVDLRIGKQLPCLPLPVSSVDLIAMACQTCLDNKEKQTRLADNVREWAGFG